MTPLRKYIFIFIEKSLRIDVRIALIQLLFILVHLISKLLWRYSIFSTFLDYLFASQCENVMYHSGILCAENTKSPKGKYEVEKRDEKTEKANDWGQWQHRIRICSSINSNEFMPSHTNSETRRVRGNESQRRAHTKHRKQIICKAHNSYSSWNAARG